jgi:hypothetical protein
MYDCGFQGLAAGCADAYFSFLGCQYVDVTDLPGGRYLLRASVNYGRDLCESNYDNNSAQVPVEFCDDAKDPLVTIDGLRNPRGLQRLNARGQVTFVKPPLAEMERDPLRDGAVLRVGTDGAPLVEVAIPGGARGSGCTPRDGWTALKGGKGWLYRNVSGKLDRDCSVSAAGIRRLKVTVTRLRDAAGTPSGFVYSVRGRGSYVSGEPPSAVLPTLVLGRVTGPCGSARLEMCRPRGNPPRRVACTL